MRVPNRGGSALAGRFAPDDVLASYHAELPEVPHAEQVAFGIRDLAWARAFAVGHTSRLGLPSERLEYVALAVGELATNSIRHGGGSGVLRIWAVDGHVVCEVRDGGHLEDRLAGGSRPLPGRSADSACSSSTIWPIWSARTPGRPGRRSGCTSSCPSHHRPRTTVQSKFLLTAPA